MLLIEDMSLIVTSDGSNVFAWDCSTGDLESKAALNSGETETELLYSVNSSYILCLSQYNVKKFYFHTGEVSSLSCSVFSTECSTVCNDTLIRGSFNGSVTFYDLSDGKEETMKISSDTIIKLHSVNKTTVFSVSKDLTFTLFNIQERNVRGIVLLPNISGTLHACSSDSSGTYAALAINNLLVLINVGRMVLMKSFEAHTLDVHSVTFMKRELNCDWVITGSADHTCKVWEAKSGKCKSTFSIILIYLDYFKKTNK